MDRDDDLLDIKQAAALLKVSETSLRRWTNAGLLHAYRVGGRRERRFRRSDLLAFLRRASPRAEASAALSGHVCGFYSNGDGRNRQLAAYILSSLRLGCRLYFAVDPGVWEEVRPVLEREHRDIAGDLRDGQLVLLKFPATAMENYTNLKAAVERMEGNGGQGLVRAVGDVSSSSFARHFDDALFAEVLDFESHVDQVYRRSGIPALCLYDARSLTGLQASALLRVHPDTMRYPMAQLVE